MIVVYACPTTVTHSSHRMSAELSWVVESNDVDLPARRPSHHARTMPLRAVEADRRPAETARLLADAGILIDIGDGGTVVAQVADCVEIDGRLLGIHGLSLVRPVRSRGFKD